MNMSIGLGPGRAYPGGAQHKALYKMDDINLALSRGLYYKSYYGRNLRIFAMS
jgi:hypothetical protein